MISFNQTVNAITAGDVTVNNGTISGFQFSSGNTATFTVTPTNVGTVQISLGAGKTTNGNGDANLASNVLTVNFSTGGGGGGSGIDLELSITANKTGFTIYDNIIYTLVLENNGSSEAGDVIVEFAKPTGTAFVEGTASQGSYSDWDGFWRIGNVPAGGSISLEVNYFTLVDDAAIVAFAQVNQANGSDSDSSPNNNSGTTPTEDDEAVLILQPGGGGPSPQANLTGDVNAALNAAGGYIDIVANIQNNGTADAGIFAYDLYLSDDVSFSSNDVEIQLLNPQILRPKTIVPD